MKIVVALEAQEKTDMEKELEEIIKSYDECMVTKGCSQCKANEKIQGLKDTTWCDFLREYTSSILDKIDKAIFG